MITKRLQKKRYIKKLTNLDGKKVWMQFDVKGNWKDHPLIPDLNIVRAIQEKVLKYLRRETIASEKELLVFILQSGLLKEDEVQEEAIKNMLESFVNDEYIEVSRDGQYRASGWDMAVGKMAVTEVPCTHCPVAS
jgi:hypothetical protein